MNSLTTYGSSLKTFRIGNTDYNYRYRIPIIKNRGPNYNKAYIEGYQRALNDLERSITKQSDNYRISFYN